VERTLAAEKRQIDICELCHICGKPPALKWQRVHVFFFALVVSDGQRSNY
jgi:hypothetical protein